MRRHAHRLGLASLTVLTALGGGCDFTAFDTFRAHAPIVTFLTPENHPSHRYGGLVAVASDGAQNDWLVVSDGLGTPVSIQPLRVGDRIGPTQPEAQILCAAANDCGGGGAMRYGVGVGGIDGWNGGTACAMTGSYGGIHSVFVRCLSGAMTQMQIISPTGGFEMAGFGLAIGTPRRHRASDPPARDIVFVGASAGPGHLFAATPAGTLDITPALPAVAAMGSALAVGRYRGSDGVNELLLVAGSTSGHVLVMHGDPRAGRPMQPLGCFSNSEPGFGLAVATADLDGDGVDEIAVGGGRENAGRVDAVHVYSTANASGAATCDASWTERAVRRCSNVAEREVVCEGLASGFGASLAGGDLDGDGRDELVVGARLAEVGGAERAGAVYVLQATGTGASLALSVASVLRDAAPRADAELGSDLRVALLGPREEVIAAVPGQPAVRAFLCTGLAGDRPRANGLAEDCR